jgi:hypothetical protein
MFDIQRSILELYSERFASRIASNSLFKRGLLVSFDPGPGACVNQKLFEDGLSELYTQVVSSDGSLSSAVRLAIATQGAVPEDFQVLVEKVHNHAFKVTDQNVEEVLQAGYHQEDVFELVVSGAVGAAVGRWRDYCAAKAAEETCD